MFNDNEACKKCIEEKGRGEYTNCVYDNTDCHNFVLKSFSIYKNLQRL